MKHKYERTEKPYEFNIEGSVREYRCAYCGVMVNVTPEQLFWMAISDCPRRQGDGGMEDLTVDPDPDGYTRCTICKVWQWCRGWTGPTAESKPEGCDADEHGERVSNRYYKKKVN